MNRFAATSAASPVGLRSWATATGPVPVDTSPMELSALSDHVDSCNGSRGKLFALRCAADTVQQFLAPRLITTLVAIACLIGVAALVV